MSYILKGTITNPDKIYGKSAYEIAVMHGFDGTEEEWIEHLKADAIEETKADAEKAEEAADRAEAAADRAEVAADGIPKPNGNGKILRSYNDEWCAVYPAMMAQGNTWWKAQNTAKTDITHVQFYKSTPDFISDEVTDEKWSADIDNLGMVMCYVIGPGLFICGSGTPISANFDCDEMFDGFTAVVAIHGLDVLDTSEVRNMRKMFSNCYVVTELDVSSFDTGKATNMYAMFQHAHELKELNVSNFNTKNVTDMTGVFNNCRAVETLDVSNWDTSKVTNMYVMFVGCDNLKTLDVSKWDVSNVTSTRQMFSGCPLETLDVSNWDVSNVTNMRQMFGQTPVRTLDVSKWNTSKVTDMSNMFLQCPNLETLDVSNWDTSKVTNMSAMFIQCSNLETLDVSNWNTSQVTDMQYMFAQCSNLETLDVSKWDVSNVTNMDSMFSMSSGAQTGDASILELDVSKWNTQSLTNAGWLFYGCGKITSLDLSNWNLNLVTMSSHMFADCNSITSIKFPASGTGRGFKRCTNLDAMFNDCKSIVSFDLNGLFENNTGKFEAVSQLFEGCISLTTINGLSHLAGSPIKTIEQMFSGCENIPYIDISWLDTSTLAGGAFRPDTPDKIYSKMDDAFLNTHKLQVFEVGDKVTLDASCALPAPSAEYITGATGVWWDADTGVSYAPTEIPANKAAIYTAVKSA